MPLGDLELEQVCEQGNASPPFRLLVEADTRDVCGVDQVGGFLDHLLWLLLAASTLAPIELVATHVDGISHVHVLLRLIGVQLEHLGGALGAEGELDQIRLANVARLDRLAIGVPEVVLHVAPRTDSHLLYGVASLASSADAEDVILAVVGADLGLSLGLASFEILGLLDHFGLASFVRLVVHLPLDRLATGPEDIVQPLAGRVAEHLGCTLRAEAVVDEVVFHHFTPILPRLHRVPGSDGHHACLALGFAVLADARVQHAAVLGGLDFALGLDFDILGCRLGLGFSLDLRLVLAEHLTQFRAGPATLASPLLAVLGQALQLDQLGQGDSDDIRSGVLFGHLGHVHLELAGQLERLLDRVATVVAEREATRVHEPLDREVVLGDQRVLAHLAQSLAGLADGLGGLELLPLEAIGFEQLG